jgi:hypothetical protein
MFQKEVLKTNEFLVLLPKKIESIFVGFVFKISHPTYKKSVSREHPTPVSSFNRLDD